MLYYAKKAIEDDEYQPDNTPLYKKVLCGNNPLGDWHYLFWKDIECSDGFCSCCRFYQGMLFSFVVIGLICLTF